MALCLELARQGRDGFQIDLSVYRDAGLASLTGATLYSEDFPTTTGLRFIYPPFAALLFAPMAALDVTALQLVWIAINLSLLAWILQTVLARLSAPKPGLLTVALLAPALLLEPVRSNFGYGQINLVLMALVLADCLDRTPRKLRGVGIGLAAAIKITPAAFGLVLLMRRDHSALGRAAGAFLVTVGVGFLFFPRDSLYFWTSEFFNTDRAGNHAYERNQAITGLLARAGVDGIVKDVVWMVLAAAVVSIAAWSAHRFTLSGDHVPAVAVIALATLLAAPIAVTHHWVYAIILVPLLVVPQYRRWRRMLAVATIAFIAAPYDQLPQRGDGFVEMVVRSAIGNAQLFSAAALLVAAYAAARTPPLPDAPRVHQESVGATASAAGRPA
ncbi:glycosyltransferase 87 family protein [Nocardia mangyaensis]|uniref:glycosyltransferase 87 family protein n=1 Tax=Nocardia mangyaensis TaxID=2213200 RepID=UPI0023E3EA31|nr:glycosyltransferase 87 family protein [Nocardia mangyaensis]